MIAISLPGSDPRVRIVVIMMPSDSPCDVLRRLRLERGWSRPDLERRSGVPTRSIAGIERERKLPRLGTAVLLARAFGVDLDLLFPGAGEAHTSHVSIKDAIDPDMLEDAIALCDPDRHPHERFEVANRTTQRLLRLRDGR